MVLLLAAIPLSAQSLQLSRAALSDSLLVAADSITALGQRSSPDSAIPRIRKALALESSPRAHAQMADAFAQLYLLRRTDAWAYDSAVFHSRLALAQEPKNTRALYARASAEGSAGNHAARIAGVEHILAIDSTFERGAGLLITAYADAGRDADAIALGERLKVLQPRNAQARFRLGWQYGYLWDQKRAIGEFEALAADTLAGVYRSWARGELAYMARARGDYDAAIRHMEDAVRAVPGDLVSQLGLAMMLLTAGKPERARPLAEQALARDSNATGYGSFSGRLLLGWAAKSLGDTALARKMFADAERGFGRSIAAGNDQRISLLRLFSLQGRTAEAIELLKSLPALNLYGGPDDNDGTLIPLHGLAEYEAFMTKRRDRVIARRARL